MGDKPIKSDYIGLGINHFTGERCNQIVDGDIKTSGNDGKTTFELCKTEEEVFSKLNIKVDAAVDYAGAEIKARVDFAKELTRKRNTTTVLVFVEKSVSKTLTGPKFLPEVSTASVKDLVRAGGDSYMSSVREGAQFVAAYSFTAASEESKMNLDVELNIKYKEMFKLNAQVKLEQFARSNSSSLNIVQKNFGGKQPGVNTEMDAIIAFADDFAKSDVQTPVLLGFETSSYNTVPGAPAEFDVVQAWTRMYKQPSVSGYSLATIESQANIVLLQHELVINLYQFYGCTNLARGLEENEKQKVKDLIAAIRAWRNGFRVDQQPQLPNLNLGVLVVPKADFKLQDAPGDKWIGKSDGGHSFTSFEESWINDFRYLKKVEAFMDNAIFRRIELTYAQVDPTNPNRGDVTQWTPTGQGSGTDTRGQATFRPGEVSRVGGWWLTWSWAREGDNKNCVSGLFFETKSGNREIKTKEGFGGPSHDWYIPENFVFVGFRGNAGTYVDGLLPQAVQFFRPIMYKASMQYGK